MKKLITLILAASFVLGAALNAAAVEITAQGSFDFAWGWMDQSIFGTNEANRAGNPAPNNQDEFYARQRERLQVNFIASENVQGVLYFEIGEDEWGVNGQAEIGTDNRTVEVRRAYIEFNVPNTELVFRVGMQGIALPDAVVGNPILGSSGTDMAGIVAVYPINDMITVAALWARPWNGTGRADGVNSLNDEIDLFAMYIPVTIDGVMTVTPYVAYMLAGTDGLYNGASGILAAGAVNTVNGMAPLAANMVGVNTWNAPAGALTDNDYQYVWWVGGAIEFTMLDPLTFGLDVAWGTSIDPSQAWLSRSGWYLAGRVDYQTPYVTPGLIGWWSSGDDDNIWNGSERIPEVDGTFQATSYGFDGFSILGAGDILGQSGEGTWGLALALQDISFIEDLTHQLTVAVYWGTNDPECMRDYRANAGSAWNPAYAGQNGILLTTADWAWEVNFDHKYQIYENLAAVVEMGMVDVHREKYAWSTPGDRNGNNFGPRLWDTETAWKLAMGLQYRF